MKTEYERFISKVNKTESCWNWTGSTYRGGYGHFRRLIDGKWIMAKVHRYSYEVYKEVDRLSMVGLFVCHTCDNPSCVNPDHLFLGTVKDNTYDKIAKGRHNFGTKHGNRELSFSIAQEIRLCKLMNPKLTYRQLGKLFDTSASQIHRIIKNKIWALKEN